MDLKLSSVNIKSFSSVFGILGTWWCGVSSKELGQPHPAALLAAAHVDALGLVLLAACSFLGSWSSFLGSLLELQLYS